MFQCPPGLYIAVFDKYGEATKYDPLTRFALMALARKNSGAARNQRMDEIPAKSLAFTFALSATTENPS